MLNRGVKIGEFHSRDNWGLIMTNKSISFPDIQKETVTVPGGDGVIDLSTVLTNGDIKYKNRTIKIDLSAINEHGQFMTAFSAIADTIHGQRLPIIFDEDPDFHYIGRCTVGTPSIDNMVAKFTISVDADPYKYKNVETVFVTPVDGTAIITYKNMRKRVVPTFIVEGEVQLTFGSMTVSLSTGTHIVPGLTFVQGDNIIKYVSEALSTVKVKYQEGGL